MVSVTLDQRQMCLIQLFGQCIKSTGLSFNSASARPLMGSDREGTCRPVGLAESKNMRAGAVGVYICRAVWVEGRKE